MTIYRIKRFSSSSNIEVIPAINNRPNKTNDTPEYWDIRKWPKAKILVALKIIESYKKPKITLDDKIKKFNKFIKTGYIYVDPKSSPESEIHFLEKLSNKEAIVYSRCLDPTIDRYNYDVLRPIFIVYNDIPYIVFCCKLFCIKYHQDRNGESYIKSFSLIIREIDAYKGTKFENIDIAKEILHPDKLGFFGLPGYKPKEIKNFDVFEIDQNLNYKRITIKEFQKVYDNYIQNS